MEKSEGASKVYTFYSRWRWTQVLESPVRLLSENDCTVDENGPNFLVIFIVLLVIFKENEVERNQLIEMWKDSQEDHDKNRPN